MKDSDVAPVSMVTFDPAAYEHRQIYKLMTGIIVPRPVALVSTVDSNGGVESRAFQLFLGCRLSAAHRALLSRASTGSNQPGERKDSLRNVEETREFVVNVVSDAIAAKANITAAEVAPEVDEFQLAGLTPLASEVVRPPRVAESPAQMECRLLQVIYTGDMPSSGVIVLGEVVRFHVRKDLVDDFRVDPADTGCRRPHGWKYLGANSRPHRACSA